MRNGAISTPRPSSPSLPSSMNCNMTPPFLLPVIANASTSKIQLSNLFIRFINQRDSFNRKLSESLRQTHRTIPCPCGFHGMITFSLHSYFKASYSFKCVFNQQGQSLNVCLFLKLFIAGHMLLYTA